MSAVSRVDRFPEGARARLALRDAPLPGDWAQRAACRGMDTAVFFPTRGVQSVARWIRELCAGCPVLDDCRAYALRWPVQGIFAGMSEDERVRHRRRQRREAS